MLHDNDLIKQAVLRKEFTITRTGSSPVSIIHLFYFAKRAFNSIL